MSKKDAEAYHYYDIPSTNEKKAIKFSSGQRGIFNTKTDIPPSTKYNPLTTDDFDYYAKGDVKHKRGFSFATGREVISVMITLGRY